MAGAGFRSWAVRRFIPVWAFERTADVASTWMILSMGGVELNPVPAIFISILGLGPGLLLFLAFTIAVGVMLPFTLEAMMKCRVCTTSIDSAIISAVGGKEAFLKSLLYAALIAGALPLVLNATTILLITLHS